MIQIKQSQTWDWQLIPSNGEGSPREKEINYLRPKAIVK